ncbi:4'-phosphopantetheinyl transferase family protein [Ochrovirga pacifica]|uniref:4'-phosphopantetheinyl transferase family protein n=1 Tax=Ochrovirga pacifica TaxID=1042376 RepID=UPI000255A7EE|nr:4'-phosphopantetheinyl transferase family protein [Ochrovirga pacifica]
MPLFKTIEISENTTIFVWKITESLAFLKDINLSKKSLDRLLSMKSEAHQKGFLSIRHLLKHIHLSDKDLFYNNCGKPLLTNGKHISITHSFEFSAIAISNQIIGIDIEKNREKILVIKNRFTDEPQQDLSVGAYIQKLTFIWGAKESMFKIHPCGGMNFKKDLEIHQLNAFTGTGFINTPELELPCKFYFYPIENYSLALATKATGIVD